MIFNQKDEAILIGLIFGDGSLRNNTIIVEHSEKQKDYVYYKASLLHSVIGGRDIVVHHKTRKRTPRKNGKEWINPIIDSYSFRKSSKSFSYLRPLIYNEKTNKKQITPDLLSKMDLISLILIYLDDGSLCVKYTYPKGRGRVKCG